VAGILGPPLALTVGGLVSIVYAGVVLVRGGLVRDYRGAEEDLDDSPAVGVEPPDAEELGDGDPITPPTAEPRAQG
jgi:hypothetical protein